MWRADSDGMENRLLTLDTLMLRGRHKLLITAGYLSIAMIFAAEPVAGQSLPEALQHAYDRSEEIASARAQNDADRAGITISKAGGLPTVGTTVGLSETLSGSTTNKGRVDVSGEVSMPLFQGGAVRNGVRAARSRSDASSFGIAAAEMGVFGAVVTAYADVIRDQHIVDLTRNNLRSLTTTLNATRARFRARDLTRTDVAQAESRAAIARGELETAEAQLKGSIEEFRRLTGLEVVRLAPLPPLQDLPANAEMAAATALEENPQLISARSRLESQRYEVKAARAEALPKVSAVLNGRYSDRQLQPTIPDDSRFGATVGVTMNMSLFRGGQVPARVSQATAREMQALQEAQGIERVLVARARSDFANWRAAKEVVVASGQAVTATQQALSGVRSESDVGSRTILDILNAEQELRNAQVQLANSERDSYLAAFSLLMTMGRAQARNFGIGGSAATELPTIREFSSPNGSAAAMGPDAPSQNLVPDADLAPVRLRPPMMAMPSSPASSSVSEPPLPASPAATAALRPAEVRVAKSAEEKWSPFPSTHWVVQLAAHESAAAARAHWDQLQPVIGGIIPDGAPMVALAPDAPKTVYRLAIGAFADFSQAETACSDLRVQGQSCIVRRVATLGAVQWIEQKSRKAGK